VSMQTTDLPAPQQGLVDCYQSLVRILSEHREALAPFEERNALKATAALWQVVNGLDLDPGHLYDLGV
jgi:hypothetical protein